MDNVRRDLDLKVSVRLGRYSVGDVLRVMWHSSSGSKRLMVIQVVDAETFSWDKPFQIMKTFKVMDFGELCDLRELADGDILTMLVKVILARARLRKLSETDAMLYLL